MAQRDPLRLELICDEIGRVEVVVDGDLAAGGRARIADAGPLALSGEPGFSGLSGAGHPISISTEAAQPNCRSPRRETVDLTRLVAIQGGERAAYVTAVGVLSWTIVVTGSPVQRAITATRTFPFESALQAYLASRPGDVTVAVAVRGRAEVFGYTRGATRNYTASIVKVAIMAAVMDRARREARELTAWERSQIEPMIRVSDNSAATALWDDVGQGPAVADVMRRMGARDVIIGPGGLWGLTQTSAADWVAVLKHFSASTSAIITDTNRAYADYLMSHVNSDQDWGVTAGPPAGTVRVKNGWLPRVTGWHVNSIGNSTATPTAYAISVLTHNTGGTQAVQENTIEGVSRMVWSNRDDLVTTRGDWTGDRATDLIGLGDGGGLRLYAGDGTGALAAPEQLGGGWGGYSWIGSPGDFDGDGLGDLVAVRSSDGAFVAFRGRGGGTFKAGAVTATGFGEFARLTTAGRFDAGSASLDVLAMKAGGETVQLALTTAGRPIQIRSLGTALGVYDRIVAVRDSTGDGWGEVWALTARGTLRAYDGTTDGFRALGPSRTGWGTYPILASPGDLDGDGVDDLVAVDEDEVLQRFAGSAGGGLGLPHAELADARGLARLF